MKPLLTLLIFALGALPAWSATPQDLAINRSVRRTVIDLVQQQRLPEARTYLAANLRPETTPTNLAIDIAQQWTTIAVHFFNIRDNATARTVADEAFAAAGPLVMQPTPGCADLFCNLGLLCERLFQTTDIAREYYQAAVLANPTHTLAQDRLRAAQAKLAIRNSGTP
jgi:hypothetical protein